MIVFYRLFQDEVGREKRPMRISLDINRDAAVAAVNQRWEDFFFSAYARGWPMNY